MPISDVLVIRSFQVLTMKESIKAPSDKLQACVSGPADQRGELDHASDVALLPNLGSKGVFQVKCELLVLRSWPARS